MPSSNKRAIGWLWLSVVVIVLDQLSKWLVLQHLSVNEIYRLMPYLNFTLRYNSGAAFSFLHNAGGWHVYLLIALPSLIALVLLIWLWNTERSRWFLGLSLGLIIGGALGNVIDRLRLGHVVDFVDFHIGHWHFATFNVADSAVCVGAFFLVLQLLFGSQR